MQAEYQSPESRNVAVIEDSYSYVETLESTPSRFRSREQFPAHLFRYRVIKRCLDVALILLASPFLLLTMGVVAVVVMLSSPGPIFYSHRRIRKDGAFFSMLKFRTMCVNSTEVLEEYLTRHPEARAEWNKTHKLRHDPRITAVGSFLRRYSLDELPQMWNVLLGHMTLVGPRPIVAAEVEKYGDSFECYCRVKPGLTGLWQVSGRSELSYGERVALDCQYVNQWSLAKDFKILAKTVNVVIHQDGAF
ncbi:sugar transferase [Edaphobacter flagellatus]|uniref:sugar transferase n=1 Tax=Edaphobacter flagellatus TaxID=1933044 RepID=UPI0021B2E778|nr:sugar transferase [Edaphobacter flagellatus]